MKALFHHTTISVRDLQVSQSFYEKLGFQQVHKWSAEDGSLHIVHLRAGEAILEIFAYAKNSSEKELEMAVANDLPDIGMKHVGLEVEDVRATFETMKEAGCIMGNDAVKVGRTGIDYFFTKDPDGLWVEIVEDKRGQQEGKLNQSQIQSLLEEAKKQVEIGAEYTHYKGGRYIIRNIVLPEATMQPAVLYEDASMPGVQFVRPIDNWLETVLIEGKPQQRFTVV